MAPVNIKYIVSFSTQDDCHKANNLVTGNGSKCWLSNKKDCTGKSELILQLEEPSQLAYLDIGAIWCATLEVRVGRSDWPQTMDFKPLLRTVVLMSSLDCRLSRGIKSTQMFSKKDFLQTAASELWDRLHIICRQPYRKDVQFGLSFIHIKSVNPTPLPEVQTVSNTNGNQVDKPKFDTSSIQKHFFGEKATKDGGSPADMLKYRLMKMAGSTENGCEQEQALSRTAKLVLKASESASYNPRRISSPLPKRGLFSEHCAKKNDLPIDEEMRTFLPTLNVSAADIDKVTIADLRHKFERRKRRKLTKEEKRTFSEICQDFFYDLFDNNEKKNIQCPSSDSGAQVHKKLTETDVSFDNLANRPVTSKSDKKIQKSPIRKRESQLMQASPSHGSEYSASLRIVNTDCSSFPKSPMINKFLNNDDQVKQPVSGTSTKDKPLFKASMTESSSNHLITNVSSSSFTVKNQNLYAASKHNLNYDQQDSLLNATCSHHEKLLSDKGKETVSQGNVSTSGDGIVETNSDLKSSISYDSENKYDNSDVKPKAILSIQSPVHKIVTVKDECKSHPNLCSPKRSIEANVTPNSAAVCSGKPAKLKKLNKISFDLFQEFSMEIMNNKNDTEDISKGEFSHSESKNGTNSSMESSYLNVTKNVSLTNNTPQKSILQSNETVPNKITPTSAKGKIYRMYSSRKKAKTVNHTEINPELQSTHIDSDLSSCSLDRQVCSSYKGDGFAKQEQNLAEFDNNCDRSNHITALDRAHSNKKLQGTFNTNISKSILNDIMTRDQKNKMVSDLNMTISVVRNHLSDEPSLGSRRRSQQPNVNRRRTKSTQSKDTTVCDMCNGHYPSDAIYSHRAFCVPSHNLILGAATSGPSRTDSVHEMLIDEVVDCAECPICLQRFSQDVLLVHASECGI